ncbi:MAG: PH domain-containing protein [Thermoanaerobaculia bacterium]
MTTPETFTSPTTEPGLRRLDPRVVRLWRVTLFSETVGLVIAVRVLGRFVDQWVSAGLLLAVVAVLGLTLTVLWPPARYRAWGFRVREDDLFVRRGVLSRTTSVIPHARIQHVDTRSDLLERWFGLARVIVYTAGIRGAELIIPGLAAEEAEALRDRLAALGGVGDAV